MDAAAAAAAPAASSRSVDAINAAMASGASSAGLGKLLGITVHAPTDQDVVSGHMVVTPEHLQPMGLLHGGATAALAEHLGSHASQLHAPPGHYIVGLSLAADHVASGRVGDVVVGAARPIHRGKRTQIWHIDVFATRDGRRVLLSSCRLTTMNVKADDGTARLQGAARL